jgi:hypothetical protein
VPLRYGETDESPKDRAPSQSNPSADLHSRPFVDVRLCIPHLLGPRGPKRDTERTKDHRSHNRAGPTRVSPGPECVNRGGRNSQGLGFRRKNQVVGTALEESALIPSGDMGDFEADPLAVRETFESSLSLRDLLRGGVAEERSSKELETSAATNGGRMALPSGDEPVGRSAAA